MKMPMRFSGYTVSVQFRPYVLSLLKNPMHLSNGILPSNIFNLLTYRYNVLVTEFKICDGLLWISAFNYTIAQK